MLRAELLRRQLSCRIQYASFYLLFPPLSAEFSEEERSFFLEFAKESFFEGLGLGLGEAKGPDYGDKRIRYSKVVISI